jgi:cyclophilin family peptidyl-prolyl cis-trans isomerase
MREESSLP